MKNLTTLNTNDPSTNVKITPVDQLPDVPSEIQPPSAAKLVLEAHAVGVQIYSCQEDGQGQLTWILKAPEAILYDARGNVIGHHYAGPAWKHNDGSIVTGKVVARTQAQNTTAIPWLLLEAISHQGNGVLSQVSAIQRIHTVAGQPPSASCSASTPGAESKIKYEADYFFYS